MKYNFHSQNNQWTKIFKDKNKTTIFTPEITKNVTLLHSTVQHTQDTCEKKKRKKNAEMYTLFHPLLHIQPSSTTLPVLG
jgi:hypothetical protein